MSNPTACCVGSFTGGVAPGIMARGLIPIFTGNFFTTALFVSAAGADDCKGSLLSDLLAELASALLDVSACLVSTMCGGKYGNENLI